MTKQAGQAAGMFTVAVPDQRYFSTPEIVDSFFANHSNLIVPTLQHFLDHHLDDFQWQSI